MKEQISGKAWPWWTIYLAQYISFFVPWLLVGSVLVSMAIFSLSVNLFVKIPLIISGIVVMILTIVISVFHIWFVVTEYYKREDIDRIIFIKEMSLDMHYMVRNVNPFSLLYMLFFKFSWWWRDKSNQYF